MMVLSFAMSPDIKKDLFYFDNSFLGSIWDTKNYKPINYLAKPVGVRKLINLYKKMSGNF